MKSDHSERKKTHYLVGILACVLVIASAVLFLNKKGQDSNGKSSEANNENTSSISTETYDKIICDIVGPVKSFEITDILYDALLAPEIAVFNRDGKLTELNSYVFEYDKDGKCINFKGKDQLKIKNYSINTDGLITQIIMHDYSIPYSEEVDESLTCSYDVNNNNRLQYISYQGPDGGTEGNLEYDANNHLIEFSNSTYHEIIRYNYTKFDDYGNWIERSVVYDSKAEHKEDIDVHEEYTETRIIEYYQ
jgi:hypothetical protein